MLIGAIGAVADAAPYALIVDILLLIHFGPDRRAIAPGWSGAATVSTWLDPSCLIYSDCLLISSRRNDDETF
jgi:hypothetical protein